MYKCFNFHFFNFKRYLKITLVFSGLSLGLFSSLNVLAAQTFFETSEIFKTKDAIVFGPTENPKGIVTIFTDIDCGYCRKLHSEVVKLVDLGIQVRYLAFPRQGIGSTSYNKVVSIWCSKDPKAALTQAMRGGEISFKTCENPVREHVSIGRDYSIMGTPTIFFKDGSMWPGYATADRIAEEAKSQN